ncbi:MAG: hypothetical protein K2L83_04355 [Muribaculaceae bacterium]|nr:hypothetical protein [Muribaculaceae bacterium]
MSDSRLGRASVNILIMALAAIAIFMQSGCQTVDDSRIPAMPVYIDLSDPGRWNTYGVSGYGSFNYFVFQPGSAREPSGFPYLDTSATGYGGVLLIEGMDPFMLEMLTPLAYDLACPVEKSPTVRVRIDAATYEAVCPVCDSHYDVTMGGGAPLSGPALGGEHKYGLKRYYCHKTIYNTYTITSTP